MWPNRMLAQSLRCKSQTAKLTNILNGELPQQYCNLREQNRINSNLLKVSEISTLAAVVISVISFAKLLLCLEQDLCSSV